MLALWRLWAAGSFHITAKIHKHSSTHKGSTPGASLSQVGAMEKKKSVTRQWEKVSGQQVFTPLREIVLWIVAGKGKALISVQITCIIFLLQAFVFLLYCLLLCFFCLQVPSPRASSFFVSSRYPLHLAWSHLEIPLTFKLTGWVGMVLKQTVRLYTRAVWYCLCTDRWLRTRITPPFHFLFTRHSDAVKAQCMKSPPHRLQFCNRLGTQSCWHLQSIRPASGAFYKLQAGLPINKQSLFQNTENASTVNHIKKLSHFRI